MYMYDIEINRNEQRLTINIWHFIWNFKIRKFKINMKKYCSIYKYMKLM